MSAANVPNNYILQYTCDLFYHARTFFSLVHRGRGLLGPKARPFAQPRATLCGNWSAAIHRRFPWEGFIHHSMPLHKKGDVGLHCHDARLQRVLADQQEDDADLHWVIAGQQRHNGSLQCDDGSLQRHGASLQCGDGA
jgi:hypothetical protein